MKRMILMFQFLTRLPLPFSVPAEHEDFSKGVIYFPVVGMVIGIFLFGIANWANTWVDPFTLAVILTFSEVLLTGGLHLDGLADSFDGLFSYRNKERMLEIMKDSRIGSNGVLVLIFALILKVALFHELLTLGYLTPLLWFAALARTASVFSAHISPYARPEGMGNFFIGKVTKVQMLITFILTVIWIGLFSPTAVLLIVPVALSTYLFCRLCIGKIDGMTGDTMGANTELQELLILVIVVVSLIKGVMI